MYYIFGGGPTGLTLATYLRHKGQVTLFDASNDIGGTWSCSITPNGLFTQHSPQILTDAYVNTKQVFKDIGLDWNSLFVPYNSSYSELVDTLSISDKAILYTQGISFYITPWFYYNKTVSDVLHGLTKEGSDKIESLTYLLDGVPPSVMTFHELIQSFNQNSLYKLYIPKAPGWEGWPKMWEKQLNDITFRLNEPVISVTNTSFRTTKGTVPITGNDYIFFALDAMNLYKVLSNSPDIQNNWGDWNNVSPIITSGTYNAISVQIYFTNDVDIPTDLSSGYGTPWKIIVLKTGFNFPFKSPITLVSCVVIDMTAKSNSKIPLTTPPNEFKQEIIDQVLSKLHNPPPIKTVGMTNDVIWDGNRYHFESSSSVITTLGSLPRVGKHARIMLSGPLTPHNYAATTLEAAVETSLSLLHEIGIPAPPVKSRGTLVHKILMISLIILMMIFCCKYGST